MTNKEMAEIFYRIANLLELDRASFFRVRAYRTGAEAIEYLKEPLAEQVAAGRKLTDLEGIGKDLAAKIEEMIETGKLEYIERLAEKVPATLLDILKIPGLGVKRVRQIYDELGIETLAEVKQAATEGRLASLPRFGEKLQAAVIRRIERIEESS